MKVCEPAQVITDALTLLCFAMLNFGSNWCVVTQVYRLPRANKAAAAAGSLPPTSTIVFVAPASPAAPAAAV